MAKRQSDDAAARHAVGSYLESAKGTYAAVSARRQARAGDVSTDDLIARLREKLSAAPSSVRAQLEPGRQSLLAAAIEAISSQMPKPANTDAATKSAPGQKATPAKKAAPAKTAAPAKQAHEPTSS